MEKNISGVAGVFVKNYFSLIIVLLFSSVAVGFDSNYEKQYDEIINRAARENGLDPALLKAVIKAESDFDRLCVSPKGACGLMQLMPETARLLSQDLSSAKPSDVLSEISPEENIRLGARYLKDMLYLFNGDLVKALAAYNAGPSIVKKYKGVPPYKETQNYVRKVITHRKKYSGSGKVYYYTAPDGSVVFFNR